MAKEALVKRSMVVLAVILVGVRRLGPAWRGTEPGTAGRARQAGGAREIDAAAAGHRRGARIWSCRATRSAKRSGVAKNSKGHLFVFTRSGNAGPVRGATASQLFEFDPNLKFVKQWGPDNYAAAFAHTVRVDKQDNVWMTDEGSNMVVKFNPQGQVAMVLGQKTGSARLPRALHRTRRERRTEDRYPVGSPGTFNRPTDVTWDTQGNIFVSDGYNNSRVAKMTKDGTWVKALGTRGAAPNQFNTPHGITSDAKGNIYVAGPRQPPHPGVRSGSEPGQDHRQRGRAVDRLHVTPGPQRSICSAATATARSTSWI